MVPYIEDNVELCNLYINNVAIFWVRLFSFLDGAEDDAFKDLKLLIVDGAHRHEVSGELGLEFIWARFAPPTMSIHDMVSLACLNSACN